MTPKNMTSSARSQNISPPLSPSLSPTGICQETLAASSNTQGKKKTQRSANKVFLNGDFGCSSYKKQRYGGSHNQESSESSETRNQAFDTLVNKELMDQRLTRTKMCSSVVNNTRCKHGSKCRFAHSVDELKIATCVFGAGCRFVVCQPDGTWAQKGDRGCNCIHPDESKENFYSRCGIKLGSVTPTAKISKVSVSAPKKHPSINNSFSVLDAEEEDRVEFAKPVKLFSDMVKNDPPSNIVSDASSDDGSDEVVVIKVPKEMAEAAMEAAMKAGKYNIRLEITN